MKPTRGLNITLKPKIPTQGHGDDSRISRKYPLRPCFVSANFELSAGEPKGGPYDPPPQEIGLKRSPVYLSIIDQVQVKLLLQHRSAFLHKKLLFLASMNMLQETCQEKNYYNQSSLSIVLRTVGCVLGADLQQFAQALENIPVVNLKNISVISFLNFSFFLRMLMLAIFFLIRNRFIRNQTFQNKETKWLKEKIKET